LDIIALPLLATNRTLNPGSGLAFAIPGEGGLKNLGTSRQKNNGHRPEMPTLFSTFVSFNPDQILITRRRLVPLNIYEEAEGRPRLKRTDRDLNESSRN
jgi:hypothetical protein